MCTTNTDDGPHQTSQMVAGVLTQARFILSVTLSQDPPLMKMKCELGGGGAAVQPLDVVICFTQPWMTPINNSNQPATLVQCLYLLSPLSWAIGIHINHYRTLTTQIPTCIPITASHLLLDSPVH